jgi:nitrate/nitrite-specific signal transduction histidine kinase
VVTGAQKPFERKHFFINRQLQGRYMLTLLVPMLVMLGFLLFTLYFAVQNLMVATTHMIREDVQRTISLQLQDRPQPTIENYQVIIENTKKYLATVSSGAGYRQILTSSLLWVFGIGITLVIIQITLLTIFFSHKLAGPIYRFEKFCHSIIEGDYTSVIKLRKGDEMQNLANLLNETGKENLKRIVQLRDEQNNEKRQEICKAFKL